MFGEEVRLPYDRPPLSKDVLLGEAPDGVALRPADFYRDNDIDLHLDTRIVEFDPGAGRLVSAAGHQFTADATVLATGGSARRLRLPGADLGGVFVLRTHDDAIRIGEKLKPGARLVVIGGGFIGTEVASAAITRGVDTVLLEAQAAPLAAVLPELAPYVVDYHRQRGLTIRTEVAVESFVGTDRVTGVRLADGEVVPADVVVVGVGMRPNDELAAAAGLATGNGVHVDADLRTAVPGVYAIGDVAAVGDGAGGRARTEHWQNAVQHGQRLATTLLGQESPTAGVPWFWSDQYDLNIQMAGHPRAGDERVWRGDPSSGRSSVLFHQRGRLTGIVTLNNGRDIRPATDLIAAGVVVDRDALGDTSADLRKLAKSLLRAGG